MLKMFKRQKIKMLLSLVIIILVAISETLVPGFLAKIIDAGIYGKYSEFSLSNFFQNIGLSDPKISYMLGYSLYMLVSMLVWIGLSLALSYIAASVAAQIANNLRVMVFEKVMEFGKSEMEHFEVNSLITRSTNNINQIQNFFFRFLRYGLFSIFLGIASIIKVLESNANMSIILLVGFSICIVILIGVTVITLPGIKNSQKLLDEQNHVFSSAIQGNMNIRSLSTQEFEIEKYDKTNSSIAKVTMFLDKVFYLMFPTLFGMADFIMAAIVYFGAFFIEKGAMSIGDLLAFSQYAKQLVLAFIFMVDFIVMIPKSIVAYNRIREVINSKIKIEFKDSCDETEKEDLVKYTDKEESILEFKKVSFKFKDADEYSLNNINFKLKQAESLGITGTIGSGKSTLLDLVFRMLEPTEGEILLNGRRLDSYSHSALSKMLSYSPQQSSLLSGSIKENLCYNCPDLPQEHILNVIDIVQLGDFVKMHGLDRDISQEAKNLSGGQRQRLSIGRCVIRPAMVYVFDDSFSALDTKTDKLVRQALAKYLKEKAMVVVSSRIDTIRDMDHILVLDDGNAVGYGTHEQLLNNCEVYAKLFHSQRSSIDER